MHVLAAISDGFHGPVSVIVIIVIAVIVIGVVMSKLLRR
jgi:hypothetical protein